jgi:sugar phosphate isomerase/epimerase
MADLVATAWTSAGDITPMHSPALSPIPITERIAAIADAGYVGLGLIADDLAAIRDSLGFAELRTLIDDAGLRHVEIELIERWWIPRGGAGNSYAVRDLLLDAADVLNPAFIKIGSALGARTPEPERLVEPLRRLADEAVAHGTRIAIETMPFSLIDTVPMGAELVAATGHPAVGLLVDAWHVFRAGTSLDELRSALWPGLVFGVELDDAAARVNGTLFEDTVHSRLLCGEGTFDLTGLVGVLRELNFDGPWGVEILSATFRTLPVEQAVKLAADSARAVLSAAS